MGTFAGKDAVLAAAALLVCAATTASAQPGPSAPAATTESASAAQPTSKAEKKKQAKAELKAERKAARVKNTAELKKLESHGYNPATSDPNYPDKLQNAQKKANSAAGASQ